MPGAAPLVSVVMPAYNAERTVREAVDSVLAQSFADLELIVCDDASRDATLERLRACDDPRLVVIANPANAGEGATRDRAIAAARGRWIAVIDADDAWAPGRLERLVAAAGSDDDVMVFDDLMQCHDTAKTLQPWRPLRGAGAFGAAAGEVRDVSVEEFVVQRRLLVKPLFPARHVRTGAVVHGPSRFGADTRFFLGLLAAGVRLRYVASPMYLYRLMPGSATGHPHKHRLMREQVEEAAALPGFSAGQRAALRTKIAALLRNERYAEFMRAVRERRARDAVGLCLRHPWMLGRLASRLAAGEFTSAQRKRAAR